MRLVATVALLVAVTQSADAQSGGRPRPEVRIDFIAARDPTAQVGVGFNAMAGTYVRWGAVVGAGLASRNDERVTTARVEGVVRFLLDPLRESPTGLYGLAGVSLMDDGSGVWEPRALLGVGVEGRARGGAIPSLEVALGGGARLAVVIRRARPNRR